MSGKQKGPPHTWGRPDQAAHFTKFWRKGNLSGLWMEFK
jgi:hypothetical protein